MKLEVVFHFSSGGTHVLETKRLGLPPSAQPDEIYQWFLIDSEQVKPLTFISMKLNPQTRIFEEGSIEFDLNFCRGMILGNSFELTRQDRLNEKHRLLLENALLIKAE